MGQKVEKPAVSDEGKDAFISLAGRDGEIDAFELQSILNNAFIKDFKFDGFSEDMTRSMVALKDADLSGKLDFEDFKKLWSDLALCKKVFLALDTDGSGYFNSSEFSRAFDEFGVSVSDATLKAMMRRYSDKDGTVKFDDFVACSMKLKTMMRAFKSKDVCKQGSAEFNIDEYIQLCIYS